MFQIEKIKPDDSLPDWFVKKRWKNAKTNEYLDTLDNFLVIKVKNKIIGAAQIVYSKFTQKHHLGSLFIEEEYRGRGLGLILIKKLLDTTAAKEIYLDTSKKYLVPYYAKVGFKILLENISILKEELLMRHPEKNVDETTFMKCHV